MTRQSLARFQLALLTAAHFTVDLISGFLPGILPVLLARFELSIGAGVWLVALCSFCANGFQIAAGYWRASAVKPLLIQLGIVLSCIFCFAGMIPGSWVWLLVLLTVVLGFGVALVHPEGLRGVCAIDPKSVSPSIATPVFMLAGFFGYACGPLVSGMLVELNGLNGLLWMFLPAALLLWALPRARIRLAVEKAEQGKKHASLSVPAFSFWQIFWLASLINTGCSIIQGLLPSYLNLQGFSLVFGGFGALLFGAGTGCGALYTGKLIRKYPVIGCIQTEIAIGIPLLILYLLLAHSAWALLLVPLTGALVGAGFPQLVVLVRSVPSKLSLGARMGLIVGGTWSVAGGLLLVVGYAANLWGLEKAMFLGPLAFSGAWIICRQLRKGRKEVEDK